MYCVPGFLAFPAEPFFAEGFFGGFGLPAALPFDDFPAAADGFAAEGGLGVDHDRVADFLEQGRVGDRIRIEIAAADVDAVAGEDLFHPLALALAEDDGRD